MWLRAYIYSVQGIHLCDSAHSSVWLNTPIYVAQHFARRTKAYFSASQPSLHTLTWLKRLRHRSKWLKAYNYFKGNILSGSEHSSMWITVYIRTDLCHSTHAYTQVAQYAQTCGSMHTPTELRVYTQLCSYDYRSKCINLHR